MIVSQSPNTRLMQSKGYAYAQEVSLVKLPLDAPNVNFCFCDFECKYVELVFASEDEVLNDVRSFLVELAHSTSTFEIKLIRENTDEYVITDDTYGTYFNKGDLAQSLKAGAYIDFKKIYDAIGPGIYKVEVSVTNFGQTLTSTSHDFQLYPYRDELADGTIKIESYQNACYSTGIDFTNLNWYKAVRLNGFFGNKEIQLEQDVYQNNARETLTIQDKYTNNYELFCDFLPSHISNEFLYTDGLSDLLFVSDYNLLNQEIYRRKEVILKEVSETTHHKGTRKTSLKVILEDKKQSIKTLK